MSYDQRFCVYHPNRPATRRLLADGIMSSIGEAFPICGPNAVDEVICGKTAEQLRPHVVLPLDHDKQDIRSMLFGKEVT